MLPSAFVTTWDCPQAPIASRLATSGDAPALSAVTYRPFACDSNATYPLPAATSSNCSHAPAAPRFATSGAAPPFSAVTYRPFTPARRLTTAGGGRAAGVFQGPLAG